MRSRPGQVLDMALLEMAANGEKPPCGVAGGQVWTAEEPSLREFAARLCAGCPVWQQCDQAATELRATWGVWAGRDRSQNREGKGDQ